MDAREYNFDGLVGPTHNFAGLSPGNVASTKHGGQVSHPRAAALQGLAKMRFVAGLGVGQAVLPPQPRPSLRTLRRLGFTGSDEELLVRAATESEHLLRLVSSASAMWTANAATVAPSSDTADGRVHLTPANLQQMFHRAIEADTTHAVLRAIFADPAHFAVHAPLPGGGQLADEGAANHTRLFVEGRPAVHLFAWGREAWGRPRDPGTSRPGRRARPARRSRAVHRPGEARWPSSPSRIRWASTAGPSTPTCSRWATATSSCSTSAPSASTRRCCSGSATLLGPGFRWAVASEAELPLEDAVRSYAFNSQLLTLPDGTMAIVAPDEARETPSARAFLEAVVAQDNPVMAVHYLDVRQSMNNGGGPACLRQRIVLTAAEREAVRARVFFDEALHAELSAWVERHYREELTARDLADPQLAREGLEALDALTGLLRLGSVYDFQQAGA